MMSRFVVTFAAAVLATLAFATSAGAADPPCFEPHSWVAGSVDLCNGALIYNDYVDDDYGADTGMRTTSHTASLAPTAGDQSYPAGQEATADLIRLSLKPDAGQLRVTALLNALYKPDSTILAVAIDTDNNPLTGGGKWGSLDVVSKGWDEIAYFKTGDPATNTITGTMPMPSTPTWRVQAAVAQSDGTVMNVAFRGVDEQAGFKGNDLASNADPGKGSWFEDKQAAALKTGDISEFGQTVTASDLTNGVTRPAPAVTGLHERVYESAYTVPPQNEGRNEAGVPGRGNGGGTGVSIGFEQTFQYLGKYQPYGIYIPPKGHAPYGMQMVFHGSSSVMSGLVNQPGMEARFGDDLNRIIVVPEARGQNGFGSDISERDLLDVMDDVEASYPVDKNQVFSGGYSQGGYITYRMAELWPDRFAGAVDWVGFTGDDENGTPAQGQGYTAGAVGNVIDFVGNLRRVPTFMLYSGADELVHVNTAVAMDNAFKATDNVFTFYLHPAAEHLTYAALDDWRKEAADTNGLTLVHNPPRVTYRTASFLDDPALGIVHDRAYWVSEIRQRKPAYEDVDLTTHACGGSVPVTETGTRQGSDPVPWNADFRKQTGLKALPKRNAIEGTLNNVASLSIDASATCLRDKTLSYDITTDGPATVTFNDGRTLAFAAAGRHKGTLAKPALGKCSASRRVRFHLHAHKPARVVAVTVYVNGKRKLSRRGTNLKAVTVGRLPRRAFTVRIVTRTSLGATRISTRRFSGCRKTKPKTRIIRSAG